ncbi:hypothetical protein [Ectobacillus panaciterrae]|uniref:hypothetical protein n=1 Tax=Ectobacillus panaciterrae TaxID=363872 RepID=UPI0003F4DFB0|nr:hypothetical protein [Ectobacillus panaciterrae]
MIGVVGILIVAIGIAIIEIRNLLKKEDRKELWTFGIFLLVGTGLGIAKVLNVHIPSPMKGLTIILKPLSKLFYGFL